MRRTAEKTEDFEGSDAVRAPRAPPLKCTAAVPELRERHRAGHGREPDVAALPHGQLTVLKLEGTLA